ncbi:MAG: dihydrofolate reductase family protein [Rhodococcus sp. (in: high G+C Gram-positive bacteria)]|jgi:dihydrofolate reductase|nr:dihydrofolate reductase family protein [Rhodococcus sp. (in: high G+C Gram-positive bacteria)]MDI6628671.1 dihydrofolate reductase family protein [Rhodococcus sp. (in: high G+C Gram-positive bacteria)]
MTLRVHNLSVSLDGFAAGPDQSPDNPMGVGGMALHQWVFADHSDTEQPDTEHPDADQRMLDLGTENIGATIMGRNMFGPVRGEWPNYDWRGWWGEEPPYHHPVFVLTHHPRPPLEMVGTTFHFTDDPIEAVLDRAHEAASGKDVRLGGGASTVRQYLKAGLVDHLHLAVSPVILGAGEPIYDGWNPAALERTETVGSDQVLHVVYNRVR